MRRGEIMMEGSSLLLPGLSSELARLVGSIVQSVVEVRDKRGTLASGFVWRPGLVVTSDEAIGEASSLGIALEQQALEVKLAGRDPSTGIALLRAEGLTAPALPLAPGLVPKAGELILAVGRREEGATARLGIVNLAGNAWRSMRGGHIDSLLRLDITLDRRGEGSPVIDAGGRVLGLALRGPRRSVLAIPAATIERIAIRILENGSVRPGYLGLGLHPVRIKAQTGTDAVGLMVLGVAPGGPGEAAGVLQGDIVTAWNGEALTGLRALFRKLGPDAAGQTVELSLIRAGQPMSVQCSIAPRPEV
jgi:S1-C subfamily serine protease